MIKLYSDICLNCNTNVSLKRKMFFLKLQFELEHSSYVVCISIESSLCIYVSEQRSRSKLPLALCAINYTQQGHLCATNQALFQITNTQYHPILCLSGGRIFSLVIVLVYWNDKLQAPDMQKRCCTLCRSNLKKEKKKKKTQIKLGSFWVVTEAQFGLHLSWVELITLYC